MENSKEFGTNRKLKYPKIFENFWDTKQQWEEIERFLIPTAYVIK